MIIAFNKPYGVVSQFTRSDERHRTLSEFGFPPDCYPIGRLDLDSEGLLLLSDEKDIVGRILSPDHHLPKEYHVQVEGIPSKEALLNLERGVFIQEQRTLPCKASLLSPQPIMTERTPPIRFRKNIPTCWLSVELKEGRNRQVRRMTAAIGYPALRLVRLRIGKLVLGSLLCENWRILDEEERKLLFTR